LCEKLEKPELAEFKQLNPIKSMMKKTAETKHFLETKTIRTFDEGVSGI
jgi:hypothetical protein